MPTYLLAAFLLFFHLSLLGQPSPRQVVAREGDGIYLLLRRHGLDSARHFQAFVELNKKNMGKGNALYAGRVYRLPETGSPTPAGRPNAAKAAGRGSSALSAPGLHPVFGATYARVELVDTRLRGAVYYLSAGHGGPDPGAIGKYGPHSLAEDEYAYDVTARLARRLMEHGALVYLILQDPDDGIRDEPILKMDRDEVAHPNQRIPLSQRDRLRQRTAAVNALHGQHKGAYQRMLAIHIDSRSQTKNIDVFFYHHENSASGLRMAQAIHKTFITKYARFQPNRDYFGTVSPRSSLYVVKYSNPPTVFIELGNIRNDLDQRRFVLPDNRQALANWICDGIIADYVSR